MSCLLVACRCGSSRSSLERGAQEGQLLKKFDLKSFTDELDWDLLIGRYRYKIDCPLESEPDDDLEITLLVDILTLKESELPQHMKCTWGTLGKVWSLSQNFHPNAARMLSLVTGGTEPILPMFQACPNAHSGA